MGSECVRYQKSVGTTALFKKSYKNIRTKPADHFGYPVFRNESLHAGNLRVSGVLYFSSVDGEIVGWEA